MLPCWLSQYFDFDSIVVKTLENIFRKKIFSIKFDGIHILSQFLTIFLPKLDYNRFGHRVRDGRRRRPPEESNLVGVQLAARVTGGIDGRAADFAGRREKHRQPGKNVRRQPEDGQRRAS